MGLKDAVKKHKPGDRRPPLRIILYGAEGIGKTTWAAAAPSPIFMGTEGGYGELTVDAFDQPTSWEQVIKDLQMLLDEDHSYKTLVIDTIDHLERLAFAEVCRTNKAKSIEAMGFGKGYVAALELMIGLSRRLDQISKTRGMHIILLGHATMVAVQNPDGPDFKKWTLKLHEKSANFMKEWCDIMLFARRDIEVHTTETGERALFAKGKATEVGERIVATVAAPGYDAKSRYKLPAELPLAFKPFAVAIGLDPVARAVAALRERRLLEAAKAKFGDPERWLVTNLREIKEWMDTQGIPAEGATEAPAATTDTEPAREPGAEG